MTDVDAAAVRAALGNLPGWHRELAQIVAPGQSGGGGERVSSSRVEAPLPINGDAADLRREIVDTLAEWAMYVAGWRLATKAPAFTAALLVTFWPGIGADGDGLSHYGPRVLDLAARADALIDPPERRKVADRIHDGLIDGKDAATVLGVAASTVRAWVASGDLEPQERGPNGRNLYALDDVRRLKIRRDNTSLAA